MKRLVDGTTVHGVKEAWYANWTGRLFWLVVFVACFATMVVQLRGLFESYLSESVGTRISQTAKAQTLEIPAAEYCNMRWLPLEEDFYQFLGCRWWYGQAGELGDYESCLSYEVTNLTWNYRACNCCSEYWRKSSAEEVVNQLLVPTAQEVTRTASSYGLWGDRSYPQVLESVIDTVNRDYNGSLTKFVSNVSNVNIGSKTVPGHGIVIIPSNLTAMTDRVPAPDSYWPTYEQLSGPVHDRTGTISLGLNGVCWKVPLGPPTLPSQQAIDSKIYHAVIHLGGFGYSLRSSVRAYGFDSSQYNVIDYFKSIPDCAYFKSSYFATFASLTGQAMSTIHTEKMKLNQAHQRLNIRFWTKRTWHLDRKTWPCKHNWTLLDKAHCNQKRADESETAMCLQYLPGSDHYPETAVSNRSCLHHHTGYLSGEYNRTIRQFIKGSQYGLSRNELFDNLKESNRQCPDPCSETVFKFDINHQEPNEQDRLACLRAIEAMLVNNGKINWEKGYSDNDTERTAFYNDFKSMEDNIQAMEGLWGPDLKAMPCTIVEYTQAELNGFIFEEYPLYSLSDLASNVGGTLGLWIGASVISFVQGAWICCLHHLFGKFRKARSLASVWAT